MVASVILLLTVTSSIFFFFNDTATTEIYTLSLHDALPIFAMAGARQSERWLPRLRRARGGPGVRWVRGQPGDAGVAPRADRKSTRLNSSHGYISYAVFCLKKKKNPPHTNRRTVYVV